MKDVMDLIYGAKIEPDGDSFLATFRDIENAFTEGSTYEEAVFNAQEVLDLMLLDRLEHDDDIPLPSPIKKGEVPISASPEVSAPALLHIARKDQKYSMADVARTMGVQYQSYQRMESGKNLTMKSLKRAASALGATVEIRLRKVRT
ncbi:type II toxin-antitoxin system HicB family antitoxin [Legionella feeleii]|uniref:Antitoxin HicB n=1 Tax=Legionella feeleii TaxID=453 RepID=A0A0W0UBC4_9GAMM|nr:type II toxin-antitoxin system HicB family antitoxin [Legionella feeleii]KTD05141.1 antitoxin HicB [Legionella feeleii]SPX61880.1 putative HTH-like transcriptional regulator, phage-related [Legionella feeleii]